MINYDKTKLIAALDKCVIMRSKIEEYAIPSKLFDDLGDVGGELEEAILDFECQIINKKAKKMAARFTNLIEEVAR